MLNAVVVGIDTNTTQAGAVNNKLAQAAQSKLYRVVVCEYKETGKGPGFYTWNYKCEMLTEDSIKKAIMKHGNNFFLNLGLNTKGEINGKKASLDRFNQNLDKNHHPLVIISQCQTKDGKTIGYSVATYDGRVKTVSLKEMIAYGVRCNKQGLIPVQNAIFIAGEDGDKAAHYKSYPEMQFITSLYEMGKNKYTEKNTVPVKKNEKALSRMDEIFSKEQIEQFNKLVETYFSPIMPEYVNCINKFCDSYINLFPKHLTDDAKRMCQGMFKGFFDEIVLYCEKNNVFIKPDKNYICDVLIQFK